MGVVRISHEGKGPDGEQIVNILHYDCNGEFLTPGELGTWLEGEIEAIVPLLLDCLLVDYNYVRTVGTVIAGSDTGLQYISSLHTGDGGTIDAAGVPQQTTLVLSKKTGIAERSAQGRMFLSPVAAVNFDLGGHLIVPSPTGTLALRNQMILPITVGGTTGNPCIWSEKYHGATNLNSVTVSQFAGVRRSRRYNVGR